VAAEDGPGQRRGIGPVCGPCGQARGSRPAGLGPGFGYVLWAKVAG
jgi:hypothetical protein